MYPPNSSDKMFPARLISAETFIGLVDEMLRCQFRHLSIGEIEPAIEVAGIVDFARRAFPNGFCIERIRFRHAVKMSNCSFKTDVEFLSCAFDESLDLTSAELNHGLSFENCTFGLEEIHLDRDALMLDAANIVGGVKLSLCAVHGRMSAVRLKLGGDITFAGCAVEGNSPGHAVVDLSNSQLVGNVIFETGTQPPPRSPSEALAAAASRGPPLFRSAFRNRGGGSASVRLRTTKVTGVFLTYAHFVGDVDLTGIECSGLSSGIGDYSVRPSEAGTSDGESFSGAQIDGNLTLSNGKFGLIHLLGITVRGSMMLVAGHSGQIEIEDGIGRAIGSQVPVVESEIGNFIMTAWDCSHFVHIHPKRIAGDRNAWGIQGISIDSSRINGVLSFWPGKQAARLLQQYLDGLVPKPPNFELREDGKLATPQPDFRNRWRRSLYIFGNLNITNCTIAGDVFLTGVNVTGFGTGRLGGRIRISNTDVAGDVSFTSPISYLADKDYPDRLLLLIARYFVARELSSQILLRKIFREEIPRAEIAALAKACPDLAGDILDKEILASEISKLFNLGPEQAREILWPEFPASKIASLIRKNPDLISAIVPEEADHARENPRSFQKLLGEIGGLRDEALKSVKDKIASFIVGAAIMQSDSVSTQVLALAKKKLEDFKVECAFKQAECRTVDMKHLSAAKLDLSGLRIPDPDPDPDHGNELPERRGRDATILARLCSAGAHLIQRARRWFLASHTSTRSSHGNDLQERRVDLHYAQIRESVHTLMRLDEKTRVEAWKNFNDILPPTRSLQTSQLAVPAFTDEKSRERQVLSDCFGQHEINLFESNTDRDSNFGRIELCTHIPGALDLRHAEIDELYLSDRSFRDADLTKNALEQGVVLDYAKITKFYVARGTPHRGFDRTHNGFPVPLSLLNLSVRGWFLEGLDEPGFEQAFANSEATTADSYLDLLDNDRVFRTSAYLEIEKLLRDRGLEEQANRILIAGHYRDVRIGYQQQENRKKNRALNPPGTAAPWKNWFKNIERWSGIGWDAIKRCWIQSGGWWRTWRPGDGRYHRTFIPMFVFRLRRPWQEYLGSALCLAWFAILVGVLVMAATAALSNDLGRVGDIVKYTALLLVSLFILRHAMRVFFDQLFWSVLAYRTSTVRLFVIILVLAVFSFLLVSGERENFEPTLAAEIADAQKLILAGGKDISKEQKWDEKKVPKEQYWPLGERVWMTLRYHIPLVSAVTSEEWQPADKPLTISGVEHWSSSNNWPRSRDWFGAMLWVNWLLWPLFLPYLIRKLIRNQE